MGRSNLVGVAGFFSVLVLAWIAGFDFNERGPFALLVSIFAVFVGVWSKIAIVMWEDI